MKTIEGIGFGQTYQHLQRGRGMAKIFLYLLINIFTIQQMHLLHRKRIAIILVHPDMFSIKIGKKAKPSKCARYHQI